MHRLFIGVNDAGRRVGESHHRTKISSQAVDQIRQLRERGESFGSLGRIFGIGKSTVRDICTCRIRAQMATRRKQREASPPVLTVDPLHLPLMDENDADDWPTPRPGPTVDELGLPPFNGEEPGERALQLVCMALLKGQEE